jgi:hypothetical protein
MTKCDNAERVVRLALASFPLSFLNDESNPQVSYHLSFSLSSLCEAGTAWLATYMQADERGKRSQIRL